MGTHLRMTWPLSKLRPRELGGGVLSWASAALCHVPWNKVSLWRCPFRVFVAKVGKRGLAFPLPWQPPFGQ